MNALDDVTVAIAGAAVAFACALGCSREEPERRPVDPYDTPYARLQDPAYTNALMRDIEVQKDIMRRSSDIERRLVAAREKDPESAETKAIEAEGRAIVAELQRARMVAQTRIRERLLQEQAAIEARKAAGGSR